MKKEEKNTKKKKRGWQEWIGFGFYVLIGGVCGYFMMQYIDRSASADRTGAEEILSLVGLFVMMYVAILVQLIIHEAGHLAFGLLSGYKFSSFRIFSFMWVKEGDKVKLKRLTIAGTGGQCLMSPPELVDGQIPVVLYNLGGSFLNLISSAVFIGLYFALPMLPYLATIFLLLGIIGIVIALMNGIPMRMGTVDNDGYNALSLSKNREARRAFWVQMKTNEQVAKGVRLKDMPEEWFVMPTDEAMQNSMVAVIGVLACNRLMDAEQFEEADALMEHMLSIESGMVGLHRNLLICDRMFVELIGENRAEVLEEMYTTEQKQFMKAMKNFPSVIRTEYVYARLQEKDEKKAEEILKRFEKCAKNYPYQNDVDSERGLMKRAEEHMDKESGDLEITM